MRRKVKKEEARMITKTTDWRACWVGWITAQILTTILMRTRAIKKRSRRSLFTGYTQSHDDRPGERGTVRSKFLIQRNLRSLASSAAEYNTFQGANEFAGKVNATVD